MPASTSTNNVYKGTASYTAAKKQWLKDEWRDEFHFLRAYRLSIYKDEDREEGRAIVRAFISGTTKTKLRADCRLQMTTLRSL
jgi:hypothetical protein